MFVYSLSKRISSKASTPGYFKLNKSLNLSHENPAAPYVCRTIKGKLALIFKVHPQVHNLFLVSRMLVSRADGFVTDKTFPLLVEVISREMNA